MRITTSATLAALAVYVTALPLQADQAKPARDLDHVGLDTRNAIAVPETTPQPAEAESHQRVARVDISSTDALAVLVYGLSKLGGSDRDSMKGDTEKFKEKCRDILDGHGVPSDKADDVIETYLRSHTGDMFPTDKEAKRARPMAEEIIKKLEQTAKDATDRVWDWLGDTTPRRRT